jgi:RecJ-like exonuclease
MTEEERLETPIVVTHNRQKHPLVQVLDISSSIEDYYGQYAAPTYDVNIVHIDENQFEVWTDAEVIKIIALF